MAGRSMPGIVLSSNFAIAISAPVLPAETAASASPLLDRVDGEPHGGFPTALAQRLARLVVHLDGDIGVHDPRARLEPRTDFKQRRKNGAVAKQQKLDILIAG